MNRALVVGIGDYGRLNRPLPGCANDLAGWRTLLASTLGVSGTNLRSRADAQATRTVLLEDLNWLLSDAGPGDQRVFFFAGHGHRTRRANPVTGVSDNVMDETLVAYPGESDDFETFMLYDSDLAALIDGSGFPETARLTLFIDSCHSGGMLRDFLTDPDDPLPRCWEPEADVRARTWELLAANAGGATDDPEARGFDLFPKIRHFGTLESVAVSRVIVAAARPEQSAWDARMADGQRHGVFSFHAVNTISAQPQISFNALVAAVTPPIATSFPQNPQLLGDSGRFSGRIFN